MDKSARMHLYGNSQYLSLTKGNKTIDSERIYLHSYFKNY